MKYKADAPQEYIDQLPPDRQEVIQRVRKGKDGQIFYIGCRNSIRNEWQN